MYLPSRRLLAGLLLATSPRLSAADIPALEALNARAQAAHGKRNLGNATPLYQQLLKAEPPGAPTAEQRALVLRFAPRLYQVPGEFFPLKDVAAILHPEKPAIASKRSPANSAIAPTPNCRG